jgi:hypothetical protein
MGPRSVNNIVNKGGTVLKSFRSNLKLRRQTNEHLLKACIGSYWR